MSDQMRKMLDELMGTNRDGIQENAVKYNHPTVCKSYLLGLCPYDLFHNTGSFKSSKKLDLGMCSKIHDPALKADYEIAARTSEHDYEIEQLDQIKKFIGDCDRKVGVNKRRLEETQDQETLGPEAQAVHELNEQIGIKLAEAEDLGAEGKVEESMAMLAHVEDLKADKRKAEDIYRNTVPATQNQQQKLRVCEVCAAFLSLYDNDRRLADHFGGRLHMGFIAVRERLVELEGIVAKMREKRDKERAKRREERDSDRSRDRDRDRRSDRDRSDRDRYRDRDRDRDSRRSYDRRDRDRDSRRRRSRSRSGDRDRRRRRSRSGSRERRRSRDRRDRSRDRERSRDRDSERTRNRDERMETKEERISKDTDTSRLDSVEEGEVLETEQKPTEQNTEQKPTEQNTEQNHEPVTPNQQENANNDERPTSNDHMEDGQLPNNEENTEIRERVTSNRDNGAPVQTSNEVKIPKDDLKEQAKIDDDFSTQNELQDFTNFGGTSFE